MRRGVWFGIVLMVLLIGAGCSPQPSQDGQKVLFDGLTNVFDNGVYYRGTQVGTIQSKETGSANVTRITIMVTPDFAPWMGNHVVFFVDGGRLEAVQLQAFGDPLEKGAPLCGFASKAEFNWFKFKTLLNDRVSAARQRALALQAGLG
ncbi:MAG: hypothetical protein WAU91_14880 [Desulfatitalea sp.]